MSYSDCAAVFKNKFRETGIVICEYLTKYNFELLNIAIKKPGAQNVWFCDGTFVYKSNDRVSQVIFVYKWQCIQNISYLSVADTAVHRLIFCNLV